MTADTASEAHGKSELVAAVKQGLEAEGATVEASGVIQGASGARHVFDLIATRSGKMIPIDVRLSRVLPLELGDVLQTYAKSLDGNARPAVIVAVPRASSDACKSAAAFGMVLIEGKSVEEVLERLSHVLDESSK